MSGGHAPLVVADFEHQAMSISSQCPTIRGSMACFRSDLRRRPPSQSQAIVPPESGGGFSPPLRTRVRALPALPAVMSRRGDVKATRPVRPRRRPCGHVTSPRVRWWPAYPDLADVSRRDLAPGAWNCVLRFFDRLAVPIPRRGLGVDWPRQGSPGRPSVSG